MKATATLPTQQEPSEGRKKSKRRRTAPRLPGMKRNARRVPTAQRVRTFYRLFHRLVRWFRPIVTIAILFVIVRFGWTQFSQSSQFRLKKIVSQTKIPQAELMRFAGLQFGDNLLQLNIKKLSKRLQHHPQIKSVQVRRQYPDTLHIQMTTHKPVAVASLDGLFYFLDNMGRPFARVSSKKKTAGFLLISGVRRTDYEQSPKGTQRLFRQSLELAREYKRRKLSKYKPLTEIQYDPILGYILRTGNGKIYIGTKNFPERIKQLHRIYRLFWRRGVRKFRYVRLDHRRHPRRAIVKLDDAVLVAQPSPNASKNKLIRASLSGH